jgi:hypothetical protein
MLMGSLVTAAIQQDRSSERYALLERLSEIAAELFFRRSTLKFRSLAFRFMRKHMS